MSLGYHPIADIFPLMQGEDFEELLHAIAAHGQREPIVLFEGKVLDGRNRYRACLELSVEPQTREFSPTLEGDPIDYVVDLNLPRRHLTPSQRAMVAADMKRLRQGARTDLNVSPIGEKSQSERAEKARAGKRSVERAEVVVDQGARELADAVRQGRLPVDTAAMMAECMSPDEQRQLLAEAGDDSFALRARTVAKQARRQVREAETAAKIKALPDQKFGVIYADPEWRFEPWSRITGMDRSADNHYATSSVEEIANRDVPSISADDCVLFLWATVPMLPAALYVMERWGFSYQTHCIWAKEKIGTGYWFRNRHELLLVGTKGEVVAPAMGQQFDSVARPRDPENHSEKPVLFRKIIETYYPTIPKIELNAATKEEWAGWVRWGAPHREPEAAE